MDSFQESFDQRTVVRFYHTYFRKTSFTTTHRNKSKLVACPVETGRARSWPWMSFKTPIFGIWPIKETTEKNRAEIEPQESCRAVNCIWLAENSRAPPVATGGPFFVLVSCCCQFATGVHRKPRYRSVGLVGLWFDFPSNKSFLCTGSACLVWVPKRI